MSTPILAAEKLTKSYAKGKTEIPVIRGLDFQIGIGEMVAVTGSSGVGKSTLLHVLGTLEPPTSGRVLFGPSRQDVFKFNERALSVFRNRALGFVFQFHYLLPEFNALENVMMPALISGLPRATVEKQARDLLEFVGLSHRLTHRPAEMSGGEQQRVAIARAVVLKPKVLLADELTGNLDSANSANVVDLLLKLNRSTGIAVLLVTHDRALAARMHRTLFMRDGVFE